MTEPTDIETATRRPSGPAVVVAGPELDDRYRRVFGIFDDGDAQPGVQTQCSYLHLDGPEEKQPRIELAARVVSMEVVDAPTASTFEVLDLSPSGADCDYAPEPPGRELGYCGGATFPPDPPGTAEDNRNACRIGMRYSGEEQAEGALQITLEVVCTSAEQDPCGLVADRGPSPDLPVRVQWTSSLYLRGDLVTPSAPPSTTQPPSRSVPPSSAPVTPDPSADLTGTPQVAPGS